MNSAPIDDRTKHMFLLLRLGNRNYHPSPSTTTTTTTTTTHTRTHTHTLAAFHRDHQRETFLGSMFSSFPVDFVFRHDSFEFLKRRAPIDRFGVGFVSTCECECVCVCVCVCWVRFSSFVDRTLFSFSFSRRGRSDLSSANASATQIRSTNGWHGRLFGRHVGWVRRRDDRVTTSRDVPGTTSKRRLTRPSCTCQAWVTRQVTSRLHEPATGVGAAALQSPRTRGFCLKTDLDHWAINWAMKCSTGSERMLMAVSSQAGPFFFLYFFYQCHFHFLHGARRIHRQILLFFRGEGAGRVVMLPLPAAECRLGRRSISQKSLRPFKVGTVVDGCVHSFAAAPAARRRCWGVGTRGRLRQLRHGGKE